MSFLHSCFVLVIIICFFVVPGFNCFVKNIPNAIFYFCKDTFYYIKNRKFSDFKRNGIWVFAGMFGRGKTLSMTHYARGLYAKYGRDLLFVSNYELYGIPYVPLVNFNQLLEIGEDKPDFYSDEELVNHVPPDWYYNDKDKIKSEYVEECLCREVYTFTDDSEEPSVELHILDEDNEEDVIFLEKAPEQVIKKKLVKRWGYKGTVVLIDEVQNLLNNRDFAHFPLELLGLLTQQRKKHCFILASCQRFFQVDKLFRSLTSYVIDCNKFWRFESMRFYDAWDYGQSLGLLSAMKPLQVKWWFIKDKDYNSYSTEQMISKDMQEKFLSNEETLARIGLDDTIQLQAVKHKSRRLMRSGRSRRGR